MIFRSREADSVTQSESGCLSSREADGVALDPRAPEGPLILSPRVQRLQKLGSDIQGQREGHTAWGRKEGRMEFPLNPPTHSPVSWKHPQDTPAAVLHPLP